MGCWNQTCGITQIHIRAGEPVMIIPLAESIRESLCYSTPFWAPFELPFYAEYNDYGAGENEEGIGLEYLLTELRRTLVEVEQGDNEYHDIPVKKADFDVECFWEAIHEQRLSINSYKENHQVGMMMVKMSVFNHLVENREFSTYDYDRKTSKITYYKYKFQDVLDGVPGLVDAIIGRDMPSSLDKLDAEDREHMKRMYFMFDPVSKASQKLLGSYDNEVSRKDCNRAALWLRNQTSHLRYGGFGTVIDSALEELLDADNRDGAIELLREHLKILFIDSLFLATRKFWSPQAGCGSQNQEHSGYRTLINAMTHVLDEEKAEWEAEGWDGE